MCLSVKWGFGLEEPYGLWQTLLLTCSLSSLFVLLGKTVILSWVIICSLGGQSWTKDDTCCILQVLLGPESSPALGKQPGLLAKVTKGKASACLMSPWEESGLFRGSEPGSQTDTEVHRVPIPVSLRGPDSSMRVSLLLGVIWAHIEVSPTSPSGTGRTGAGQVFRCVRCPLLLCFLFFPV